VRRLSLALAALALGCPTAAWARTIVGSAAADRIRADDGVVDTVRCGAGRDIVTADRVDRVAADCETVSRVLLRDRLSAGDGQHETEVEPSAASFGSTIVSVFQVSRRVSGGALAIGWSTSTDGGRTWRSGLLPEVTGASGGAAPIASDPVVAYDAAHGVWIAASLVLVPRESTQILLSRSRDGLSWSRPVVAAATDDEQLAYDKQWLACDNGDASPFRGRCYLAYTNLQANRIVAQESTDGGLTWALWVPISEAVQGRETDAVGAQPVVQPDGTVVVVYADGRQVVAARSHDGAATFEPPVLVADLPARHTRGLRAPPLPSAAVMGNGTIAVVWPACTGAACARNDVVMATSADGETWTAPAAVPIDGADHLLPALGASGSRLGIVYYFMRPGCEPTDCALQVGFVWSGDGGSSWSRPRLLSPQPMPLGWLARTSGGLMVGDYVAVAWSGGAAVPVFALAAKPHGTTLQEAVYGARLAVR
jgi:hypothetical protein